ncbi:thioredoxin family protein [Pedobacter frigoris]|uniref:peroxiredoxin family protein n=1 Tax=Pedobacter frigoris TaxID=2571272 RepID=UPI00292F64B5|nr:thioredoxin family protein [Pedobacter frigoris]
MKKNHPRLAIALISFLFLLSCKPKETTLDIRSANFGPNAVIEIYSLSGSKPLLTENLKNKPQSFKIKPNAPGYGRLVVNAEPRQQTEFLIYLDGNTYEISLDRDNIRQYPIAGSNSQQVKELLEFYTLQDSMSKENNKNLRIALKKTETAPRETIEISLKEYEEWQEKSKRTMTSVIQAFAKSYPTSMLTPILIDRFGSPESFAPEYKAIIKNLSAEVRESKEIQTLSKEIDRIARMQPGQKMAEINGKNPEGVPFNPRVLKSINVFICWTSYDAESRKANPDLIRLYELYKDKGVEFIGVSYDKHEKWWKTVIKDDGLSWPQYADLLGAKSPNPGNLSDYKSPYIFITDKSGIILSNNIPVSNLGFEITDWRSKAK